MVHPVTVMARLRALRAEAPRLWGQRPAFADWPEARSLGTPETFAVQPALFDPDTLDRVTACGFFSNPQMEAEKLAATEVLSSPPTATTFQNVACFGGRLYERGARYFGSAEKPLGPLLGAAPRYDQIAISNSAIGLRFFGHWLRDDCAARELPHDFGEGLSMQRPIWPDCRFYETIFGQTWADAPAFTARRLTVIQDIGFSPDKADRLRRLRARLRGVHPAGPGRDSVVYIKRGASGKARTMSNQDELVQALDTAGVRIVEAEGDTETLVSAILDARLIISIEGSQLAHGVYSLAEAGGILAIQPPDRFYNPHHEWARLLGMRYGIVIGTSTETGYTVAPDEVLRMIDQLLAVTPTQAV